MPSPFQQYNQTGHVNFCIGNRTVITTMSGVSAVAALVVVFSISCWAWRSIKTGAVHRLSYVLLPMYNVILRAICLVLVVRGAVWLLVPKSSVFFDFLNWVLVCPLIAMLRDGVAIFLCLNSAGYDAMRKTAAFMLLWVLAFGTVGWICWSHSTVYNNDFHTYFFVVYNGAGTLLHLGLLVVKLVQRVWFNTRVATRPAPVLYSTFLSVILALFLVLDLLAINQFLVLACTWSVLDLVYNFAWPLLAYGAMRVDSRFWRRTGTSPAVWKDLGMPLLDTDELSDAVVIDFAQVELRDVIAVGGTATVYNATYKGKAVAVKRFVCDTLVAEQAFSYIREISILSKLRHPNVVVLHGVAITPPFVCLVMEVTSHGSLFHVLTRQRRLRRAVRALHQSGARADHLEGGLLTPVRRLYMMRDAFSGLAFLHATPPIVHGDVKSLNMLIDVNWVLKLCDFGESRYDHVRVSARPAPPRAVASNPGLISLNSPPQSPRRSVGRRPTSASRRDALNAGVFSSLPTPPPMAVRMSSNVSRRVIRDASGVTSSFHRQTARPVAAQGHFKQTPQWAAPEVFTHSRHSTASDVYSCASVLYELLAFRPPYYRIDPGRVPRLVVRGILPQLPDHTAEPLQSLIFRCWDPDPSERPTAAEALDVLNALTPQALAESDDLFRPGRVGVALPSLTTDRPDTTQVVSVGDALENAGW